jgi:hypothetical protein
MDFSKDLPVNGKKFIFAANLQRGVRVVEGARLESVYTPKGYRGFESLPLCSFFSTDFIPPVLKKEPTAEVFQQ